MPIKSWFNALQDNSLYHQLLRSYLVQLSILSLVILLSVTTFYWINKQTDHYIKEISPGESIAHNILNSVSTSMRLLNEWVINPESATRNQRLALWKNTIYKGMAELSQLKTTDASDLAKLRQHLHSFEIEQWIIEDMVHMPGNSKAYDLYSRKMTSIKEQAFSTVSALINNMSQHAHERGEILAILTAADTRGFFTYADSQLIEFIHTGNNLAVTQFSHAMTTTTNNAQKLLHLEHAYTEEELSLIIELERLLKNYTVLAQDVIATRNTPQWNLANFRLKNYLIPLNQKLEHDLTLLLSKQHELTANYSGLLLVASNAALITFVILFIALIFFAFYLSRKSAGEITQPLLQLDRAVKQLAKSELHGNIEIQGCNEVTNLANTFNTMRVELNQNKQQLLDNLHKIEAASRAKNTFLSSMSHEFRTPLNAIIGFNQLITLTDIKDRASLKDSQAEIDRAAHVILALVESVLEMVTLDDITLNKKELVISTLLSDIIESHQAKAKEFGVKLELATVEEECVTITTDPTCLEKIINNIIDNAIVHNNHGGKVQISYHLTPSGTLRINIKDNGPGLSTTDITRVFSPFDRLGKENLGESGLGIGLTISKGLANLIDAEIGVESVQGQGSTFFVELNLR